MIKRNNKGQEATEFVLITILVFFSALTVVFIFGNKIAAFFNNDSSVNRAAKAKVNVISPQESQKYNNNVETLPDKKFKIGERVVSQGADGSITFQSNGQMVTIDSSLQDKTNAALNVVGGWGGLEELMNQIDYMKRTYDPDNSEAVEIFTGNQSRAHDVENNSVDGIDTLWGLFGDDEDNTPETYSGAANAEGLNALAIKIGQKIMILNIDQKRPEDSSSFFGNYKMEGSIGSSLDISGQKAGDNAKYSANVTTTAGGLKFTGSFDLNSTEAKKSDKSDTSGFWGWANAIGDFFSGYLDKTTKDSGNWTVNFTDVTKNFTLQTSKY